MKFKYSSLDVATISQFRVTKKFCVKREDFYFVSFNPSCAIVDVESNFRIFSCLGWFSINPNWNKIRYQKCVDVYKWVHTGWVKKKWDLKKHGHNYSEIHQKKKKLVCFGKFSLNAAGLASNLSKLVAKWLRKMNMKLVTPLKK